MLIYVSSFVWALDVCVNTKHLGCPVVLAIAFYFEQKFRFIHMYNIALENVYMFLSELARPHFKDSTGVTFDGTGGIKGERRRDEGRIVKSVS